VPTILNKMLGLNIIWPFFICFWKNFRLKHWIPKWSDIDHKRLFTSLSILKTFKNYIVKTPWLFFNHPKAPPKRPPVFRNIHTISQICKIYPLYST